jgi:threonine/homoserine/homoserine lactone efflux protein
MFLNLPVFLGVAAAVIITPGQDTALTIRNTLLGGRRGGIATAAGVAAGQALWTLAASLGIAALLLASPVAFRVVRIAGAAYLIVLGRQALLVALRSGGFARPEREIDALPQLERGAAFRQGVLSNLGNPKMAVFFTSLLPQFVAAPAFVPLAALGVTFCTMTLVWLTLYAIAVARAGEALRAPRVRRALEGATGAALVGLGIWVIVESARG